MRPARKFPSRRGVADRGRRLRAGGRAEAIPSLLCGNHALCVVPEGILTERSEDIIDSGAHAELAVAVELC
jgi:hypothetical protein